MKATPAIVTVAGTGRVTRSPDVADVTFVIEAASPTAVEARGSAAETAGAVLAALAEAGVAGEDLRTAGLDVSPTWDHEGNRMIRTGFAVTNRIAATVRDLEGVGRVIDAGLGAGATGIDGVRFRLEDEGTAMEAARFEAVADTRRRAATIAEALGTGLGVLRSITETPPSAGVPWREARFALAAASADAPTPVLPGAVEVAVTVTGEWELLPTAGPDAGQRR